MPSWFQFGGGAGSNPEFNPVNYFKIASTTCTNGSNICAIFATVQIIFGTERPVIDQVLSTEIQSALSTGMQTNNVKLYTP